MTMEIVMHRKGEVSKTYASSTIMPPATVQRIMNVVGESRENQDILRQVIDNVFSTYGQPVMTTILWHLNAKGVDPKLTDIDIPMFHKALQQIIGDFADLILNEICADLDRACHEHPPVHDNPADKYECPLV